MIPGPYDDSKLIGSPAWWLKRLLKAMDARDLELQRLDDYYSGRHPLAFASEKFRQRFGTLFRAFADNWCELVVDAVEERLRPQGFRIPNSSTAGAGESRVEELTIGDRDAWDIWQRNGLDLGAGICHTEALINKEAAAIVWWDPDETDRALITIEHPRQVYVETLPENPWKVRAALKRWTDDSEYVFATLYLPELIFKFRSDRKVGSGGKLARDAKFFPRDVPDEAWPLENKLREVPVVPFRNKPRLLTPAASELDQVIPIQDAVNKLFADLMIASEFQSWKQRFITGMEIPTDPVTNQPVFDFKQLIERVWVFEGENVKVGELGEVNLEMYVKAVELAVQHIASRSRTPPHYFYLSGQFPSGESIKSAETGLVAKTRRKMVSFGESWEAVIRLAFAVMGDDRAKVRSSETIWGDPEFRSEAEHVDALTKLQALGVPQEQLWEDAGYSPQQIERFKVMRAEEAAQAAQKTVVPMVFDPMAGQFVEPKDLLARREVPAGTQPLAEVRTPPTPPTPPTGQGG